MERTKLQTTEEISKRMKKVHTRGGKAERLLAKSLWHSDIRYRLNFRKLPGSPDIAITKWKVAVFVDGDFWHGRDWSERREKIHSNREYWIPKIEANMARDQRNDIKLTDMGWEIYHFWEREVLKHPDECRDTVIECVESRKLEAEER